MIDLSTTSKPINIADLRPIARSRRPVLINLILFTVVLMLVLGWLVVLPHIQAVTYLALEGHEAHWSLSRANWRYGGGTAVTLGARSPWTRANIKDADLLILRRLHQVETVDFSGSVSLSDVGLKTISEFPRLKTLHLGKRKIGNWYSGPDITDVGISELARLQSLRELSLDGHRLTDESLKTIEKMHDLQYLDVSDTSITDAGLEHLYNLKNLKTLYLEMNNLTPAAVAKLQSALPGCTTLEAGINRDRSTGTLQN